MEFYEKHNEFVNDLKTILNYYAKGLDKRDLICMEAKASLSLLDKLIDESEIFNYIKPTKKKILPKRNAPFK